MKSREYIENKIKKLEDLRSDLLKEYQEKLDAGNNDEVLWQYISNKNIEIILDFKGHIKRLIGGLNVYKR